MKSIAKLFIVLGLTFLLASCSNVTDQIVSTITKETALPPIEKTVLHQQDGQEFQIINYYQEVLDFLDQAKEQPANTDALYKQMVYGALKTEGVDDAVVSEWLSATPADLTALKRSLNTLIRKQDLVNKSIKDALTDSAKLLPGGNKTIHVIPAIPELDLAGFAFKEDSFVLLVDPGLPLLQLKYSVAHEYHHTIYMETPLQSAYTLMDAAIVEGKADVFAELIYPNMYSPWKEPLSVKEHNHLWEVFVDHADSTDPTMIETFMQGSNTYGIPQYANYRIGYEIMRSFVDGHPQSKVEEWTTMPSNEIFKSMKNEMPQKDDPSSSIN